VIALAALATIVPTGGVVLSYIASTVENIHIVIGAAFVFIFGTLLAITYALIAYKKITQLNISLQEQYQTVNNLKQTINILQKNVDLVGQATNGMEENYNSVTITYKHTDDKYYFDFEKHFTITTDPSPIRYAGQFYANKHPTNAELARKFYDNEENKIKWDDLKIYAKVRYSDDIDYSDLVVRNQLSSGNLIPFDINFKNKNGNIIRHKKGKQIVLKYGYQIPRKLWGSYINRSIGFFSVDPRICIVYDGHFDELKYNISRLDREGNPFNIDEKHITKKCLHNGGAHRGIELIIKAEPLTMYRVSWEAQKCFGGVEEDSEYGRDELGVTNR